MPMKNEKSYLWRDLCSSVVEQKSNFKIADSSSTRAKFFIGISGRFNEKLCLQKIGCLNVRF